MTVPAKIDSTIDELAEALFIKGDYSNLTIQEQAKALMGICHSIGLNPLTRPIEFIKMNGKLVPYAKRDCADQLRKLNGISLAVISREEREGLLIVHVRATDKTGREDEDFGAVPMNDAIKGEARANAFLKCITKAKRRATLSISGLGFLDETEVESVQRATIRRPSAGSNPMLPPHEPDTGEIDDYADKIENVIGNGNEAVADEISALEKDISEKAAQCATIKALTNYFHSLPPGDQVRFKELFTLRRSELENGQ